MKKKSLFSLFFLVLPILCSAQGGWKLLPQPIPLGRLDIVSDSVYVCLSGDTVLISSDQGLHWKKQPVPFSESRLDSKQNAFHFRGLHFVNDSTGTLYGNLEADVVHMDYYWIKTTTSNSGKDWNNNQGINLAPNSIYDIFSRTEKNWYVANEGFLYSIPHFAGEIWDETTGQSVYKGGIMAIDFEGKIGIGVDYGSFQLIRSSNLGLSWKKVSDSLSFRPGPYMQSWDMIVRSAGQGIWYASIQNSLYRSSDSGKTWQVEKIFPSWTHDIAFYHTGLGYIIPEGADYVYKTTDRGASWFAQSVGYNDLQELTILNDSVAYINRTNSLIRTSSSQGGPGPVLSMPRYIDFGILKVDSFARKKIRICNVGDSTLIISKFTVANSFLQLSPASFTIPPHACDSIEIGLQVTGDSAVATTVRIKTNTSIGDEQFVVAATGKSQQKVSANPSFSNTFTIVPNPSHSVRSIYLQKQPQEVVTLEIFDLLGRVILRDRTSQNIYHVTNVLHSGCYHVRVIHPNGEQASGKMIVE